MEKLYNNRGEVAVAVSGGYGAGWSTWNPDVNPMDKKYNQLILDGDIDKAIKLAKSEGHFTGGLEDCSIKWVDEGERFRIDEYDGSESLIFEDDLYLEA